MKTGRDWIVALALLLVPASAGAGKARDGRVWLGLDAYGARESCYVATFTGPTPGREAYEKRQKSRAEPIDPAELAAIAGRVSVQVSLGQDPDDDCIRASSRPEKIVFVQKGQDEPALLVPLASEDSASGGYQASATIPLSAIESLRDRDLDVRVVFAHGVLREKWKHFYTSTLLR